MLPYLKAIGLGLAVLFACLLPALLGLGIVLFVVWVFSLLPEIFGAVAGLLFILGFVGYVIYRAVKWVIVTGKEFKEFK